MPTITFEPELLHRIEQAAQENQQSVADTLVEAVQQYLWELDRKKISRESALYRQKYPELKSQYLGKYIAMRDGMVVDHAADFQSLYARVRERFPNSPVLMTRVEEESDKPIVRHGFRFEANGE
ncbi:MAG: hypothetical protein HZC40_18680 [Chloroflexi bacterium]|nr:hypothetical protein [Chloroflexota bacterium]